MTPCDYFVIGLVVGTIACLVLIHAIPCNSCKGYYWSQGSQTG